MKLFEHYFSVREKRELVEAIRTAERETSGEIRIFFEKHTQGMKPEIRAERAFNKLEMWRTAESNAVLFYLAFDDKKFSVLGDSGIHEHVTQSFWDDLRAILSPHFARGEFVKGLKKAIKEVGTQLKQYFPYQESDRNELSDEIYFED